MGKKLLRVIRRTNKANPWMTRPVWDHVTLDPTLRTAAQLGADVHASTHAA